MVFKSKLDLDSFKSGFSITNHCFTERNLYQQKCLKKFYTEKCLHWDFLHRNFYIKFSKRYVFEQNHFLHREFLRRKKIRREVFTQRFFLQEGLQLFHIFFTRRHSFTEQTFPQKKMCRSSVHREKLLHITCFLNREMLIQSKFLRREVFTQWNFHAEKCLQRETFTQSTSLHWARFS